MRFWTDGPELFISRKFFQNNGIFSEKLLSLFRRNVGSCIITKLESGICAGIPFFYFPVLLLIYEENSFYLCL